MSLRIDIGTHQYSSKCCEHKRKFPQAIYLHDVWTHFPTTLSTHIPILSIIHPWGLYIATVVDCTLYLRHTSNSLYKKNTSEINSCYRTFSLPITLFEEIQHWCVLTGSNHMHSHSLLSSLSRRRASRCFSSRRSFSGVAFSKSPSSWCHHHIINTKRWQ